MQTDLQLLHARTLIAFLYEAPHERAMVEITGLAPKRTPIKRYFTDAGLAALFAVEVNAARYSTFLSVNPRKAMSGYEHDVPYTHALGLDIDDKKASRADAEMRLARAGLLPSATTDSGHGAHYYLKLVEHTDPIKAKRVNERLCKFTGSDAIQNSNRILRMPGTTNWKTTPVWCFLTGVYHDRRYTIEEIDKALNDVGAPAAQPARDGIPVSVDPPMDWWDIDRRLDPGARDIIVTGEKNAYSDRQITRSEADWVAVCALVEAGVSDDMIAWVYANFPVGLMKYKEAGAHYLNQTIQAARRATATPVERRVVAATRTASPRYTGGAGDQKRAWRAQNMYR